MERYVQALCAQIQTEAVKYRNRTVDTVFLGGGTPSILPAALTEQILEQVFSEFTMNQNAEISMEMNPGTASLSKLTRYRKAGINRLSIGLQSAQDDELESLGRIHTWEQFKDCFAWARQAGFSNINVDVMAALPKQSLARYEDTLEQVCALSPEHISAYSLIVEEGTPFYDRYHNGTDLPDEETERMMYVRTKEILAGRGYHRYEISNYAKAGYECKHNTAYWKRTDYLGLGLGAASLIDSERFTNSSDIEEYLRDNCKKETEEILTQREQMEEFMFLGLRLTEGICPSEFESQFGSTLEEVYGETITQLERDGLIRQTAKQVRLTEYGIDISNYVFAQFI